MNDIDRARYAAEQLILIYERSNDPDVDMELPPHVMGELRSAMEDVERLSNTIEDELKYK